MKREGFKLDHRIVGAGAGGGFSFLIWYLRLLSVEATFILILFNLLFISLVFSLSGSLPAKLLMLAIGNLLGCVWNCLFSSLAFSVERFLQGFNSLHVIIEPLVNLFWIVPFWSLTLTFLAHSERTRSDAKA